MLTQTSIATETTTAAITTTPTVQKVVIVNGNAAILDMMETALDAGHYDVVFVESSRHAYSQIKRVQPNLVVLCLHVDEMDGFQVLSMLKLDDDTRWIPVLTYTTPRETPAEEETGEPSETDTMFPGAVAGLMN
jgi:putative two-component system response regulator